LARSISGQSAIREEIFVMVLHHGRRSSASDTAILPFVKRTNEEIALFAAMEIGPFGWENAARCARSARVQKLRSGGGQR
jgi:hypothetical protein